MASLIHCRGDERTDKRLDLASRPNAIVRFSLNFLAALQGIVEIPRSS
jgi:hypothetical protein